MHPWCFQRSDHIAKIALSYSKTSLAEVRIPTKIRVNRETYLELMLACFNLSQLNEAVNLDLHPNVNQIHRPPWIYPPPIYQ